jgi:hypothetical protein
VRRARKNSVARGLLVALTACLVAVAALVAADTGGAGTAVSCRRAVAGAPAGLPAAVVLTTDCGRYQVTPNGRVRFLGGRLVPVPARSSWYMDLTWYRIENGRLLVGRRHRLVWRSQGRFVAARGEGVGAIALSPTRVAFSFFTGRTPTLYLARLDGAEEQIARGETPLGWTRTGALLTLSSRGEVIRVRSASGRLQRTLSGDVFNFVFDRLGGALVYVAHGTLERFDGGRVRVLARLPELRLGGRPLLTALAGVLVVSGSRRLVVLRADGSLLSSTRLPRPRAHADWAPGALAADRNGDVAFTATRGNTAYGSSGSESVYMLPTGARSARAIHREHVDFAVCERGAELAWRGEWLLYSASEGYAAAIDTAKPGRFVELSRLVRRLPGMTGGGGDVFDAAWGGRGEL